MRLSMRFSRRSRLAAVAASAWAASVPALPQLHADGEVEAGDDCQPGYHLAAGERTVGARDESFVNLRAAYRGPQESELAGVLATKSCLFDEMPETG